MAFPKKSCLGQMGHLKPKLACAHSSGSTGRILLQCCKERHGYYINGFSGGEKKINLGKFGHFGPKMVHPRNFGSASDFF